MFVGEILGRTSAARHSIARQISAASPVACTLMSEGLIPAAAKGPLRPPSASPFSRLAFAHVAGAGGDVCFAVALSGSLFFTVPTADARPNVLLYLALTMAPFAVLAPILGPLLDRMRGGRRLLLILLLAGRGVVAILIARDLQSLLLYPEAFLMLVFGKGGNVARSALVPTTVTDHTQLVEANSRLSILSVITGTFAAAMAVGTLKLFSAGPVLIIGSLWYFAGAILALRILPGDKSEPVEMEAINASLHVPSVFLAGGSMGILRASVGFMTFLMAFALKRADEAPWVFGMIVAASALGNFLGALVAPRLRRIVREETILVMAMLMPAAILVIASRGYGRGSAAMAAAMIAASASAGKLSFDSLVQRDAPSAARGRVFARYETRFQVAWVVGALIPVAIGDLTPSWGFIILAIALGLSGSSYAGGLKASGYSHRGPSRDGQGANLTPP